MHDATTAGISKKLVTIFASHLDSFIMTQNFMPFNMFANPALDSSSHLDNFIVRRDWQKLRHGGLPAGTLRSAQGFWLKYQDK
jgi:hypothetical protein